MKVIILGIALMFVGVIHAQKTSTTPTTAISTSAVYTQIRGTVHEFQNKACGLYIQTVVNGKELKLRPINLAPEFISEGSKIVFDYVETSEVAEEFCEIDAIVNVSNVRKAVKGTIAN